MPYRVHFFVPTYQQSGCSRTIASRVITDRGIGMAMGIYVQQGRIVDPEPSKGFNAPARNHKAADTKATGVDGAN